MCAAHGAASDVVLEPGYPVTMCDPAFTELARQEAIAVAGADAVKEMPAPIMGAEDFSLRAPAGAGCDVLPGREAPTDRDPRTAPPNHSSYVYFDESAMATGIATYEGIALERLADDHSMITRADAAALDAADPLASFRDEFVIPTRRSSTWTATPSAGRRRPPSLDCTPLRSTNGPDG